MASRTRIGHRLAAWCVAAWVVGVALTFRTAVAAPPPEPAGPLVRYADAEFTIPPGWTPPTNSSSLPKWYVLEGKDAQAAKFSSVLIYVFKERDIAGQDVDAALTAWAAEWARTHERTPNDVVREEAPRAWGEHPGGGRMLVQHFSYGDRKGPARNHQVAVYVDGGNGVGQAFVLEAAAVGNDADSRALLERHRATFDAFLAAVRLPSRTVLAPAPTPTDRPLTAYDIDRCLDFLEWLLDVPLTGGQRDAVRDHLAAAWTRNDRTEIDGVGGVLKARGQVEALESEKRELVRQAAREAVLKEWRGDAAKGDKLAALILGAYDAAHAPLAPGEPPLTRQAADASLEVIYFMAATVAGTPADANRPSKVKLDEWANTMAAQYPHLAADARKEIAGAPLAWAALRAAWPEIPADQRAALAKAWADSPAVAAVAGELRKGQDAADLRRAGEVMRAYDAHRRLINMGAYQLGRPYRFY